MKSKQYSTHEYQTQILAAQTDPVLSKYLVPHRQLVKKRVLSKAIPEPVQFSIQNERRNMFVIKSKNEIKSVLTYRDVCDSGLLSQLTYDYFMNLKQCLKENGLKDFCLDVLKQIHILNRGPLNNLNFPQIHLPVNKTGQKTVILDLDETLIHCKQIHIRQNYDAYLNFENGLFGLNIRPFCKQFLEELSQLAEVVIFTASSELYANKAIAVIDPEQKYIKHTFYRKHCVIQNGYAIKNILKLNREPKNIILIDNSPISAQNNIENLIPITPFVDNKKDNQLKQLLQYLKTQILEAENVRRVIQSDFNFAQFQDLSPIQILNKL
ncbi:hypothetical protein pb186bvf_009108 [Paramecium bursaria]